MKERNIKASSHFWRYNDLWFFYLKRFKETISADAGTLPSSIQWSFRIIHSRTFEPSHTSLILLRIKVVVPNGRKGLVPHNNGLFSVKVCRQICFLPNTDPPLSRGGKAHLIFECGRANSNDFNFWKQNKNILIRGGRFRKELKRGRGPKYISQIHFCDQVIF